MQALAPAFGVLFYVMGIVAGKAKMNWFVGIRTPWTMSSEKIWAKTHRLSGELFKAAAVIILLGTLMPDLLFPLMIAAVVLVAVVPIVYSYVEFKKQGKKKRQ